MMLPPLDSVKKCIKCGAKQASIASHFASLYTFKIIYDKATDQLIRTCYRCYYQWREDPINKEPPA